MFHSKARWAFHSSTKRKKKRNIGYCIFENVLFRPSIVPSVFSRQLTFSCTLRLKSRIKFSLYIYIYLYIFICIYIYIYIKRIR